MYKIVFVGGQHDLTNEEGFKILLKIPANRKALFVEISDYSDKKLVINPDNVLSITKVE